MGRVDDDIGAKGSQKWKVKRKNSGQKSEPRAWF
jgi:hypothetical protein